MSEIIFVSGASGRVGQPLVKALIKEGATVRVHARRAEAAVSLKSLGAHVLTETWRSCRRVLLMGSRPCTTWPAVFVERGRKHLIASTEH